MLEPDDVRLMLAHDKLRIVIGADADTVIALKNFMPSAKVMILHNHKIERKQYFVDDLVDEIEDFGTIGGTKSKNGNVLTLNTPLLSNYNAVTTNQVLKITSGKLSVNGLKTDSDALFGVYYRFLINAEINNINAIGRHISCDNVISIDRCYNTTMTNVFVQNLGTVATGANYGISISNSQLVRINGGYVLGLRHSIVTGGHGLAGSAPCRDVIIDGVEQSNDKITAMHVADFHGNTLDSYYKNCKINGAIHIGGFNVGFINCSFESVNSLYPCNIGEVFGGNVILDICIVTGKQIGRAHV